MTNFQPRTFPEVARAVAVGTPTPEALSIGEEVDLVIEGDDPWDHDRIIVRIASIANGQMTGVISRGNRRGARGDATLAQGVVVEFEERHVWGVRPELLPPPPSLEALLAAIA